MDFVLDLRNLQQVASFVGSLPEDTEFGEWSFSQLLIHLWTWDEEMMRLLDAQMEGMIKNLRYEDLSEEDKGDMDGFFQFEYQQLGISFEAWNEMMFSRYEDLSTIIYMSHQPYNLQPDPTWVERTVTGDRIREAVTVPNGDIQLEGDLYYMEGGNDKKPAIVFQTGSGDNMYQNYAPDFIESFVLDIFLERDFAVLLINKRGMGNSTGNWKTNDFFGRASDVNAGAQFLKTHAKINSSAIGVVGHSQGGWVAPLAASQHEDISFFIAYAGPIISVEEQMLDLNYEYQKCVKGHDEEKSMRIAERQLVLTRIGTAIGSVFKVGQLGYDARTFDYDPAQYIASLENPGLFVFGEYDSMVYAQENIDLLSTIFDGSVPDYLSTAIIPEATHSFRVAEVCGDFMDHEQFDQSQDFIDTVNAWLDAQGF